MQPQAKRVFIEAQIIGPSLHISRAASKSYQAIVTAIALLLRPRSPYAITRHVTLRILSALKCVLRASAVSAGRARTHVSKESSK
jgi:hypothetical protein